MVLNEIIEQAAGRQSVVGDHTGGKIISHAPLPSLLLP